MKKFLSLSLALISLLIGLPSPGFGQANTAKQNEDNIKRAEKVHQKVTKLGAGDKALVDVRLFDGKTFSGHIGEASANSFTVVNKSGTSDLINYSDVKELKGRNTFTGAKATLYIAIGAGAVLLTYLVFYLHNRGVCPSTGCN